MEIWLNLPLKYTIIKLFLKCLLIHNIFCLSHGSKTIFSSNSLNETSTIHTLFLVHDISQESNNVNESLTAYTSNVMVSFTDINTIESDFFDTSTQSPRRFSENAIDTNETTTLIANDVTEFDNNTVDSDTYEISTLNSRSSTDKSPDTNETTTLAAYDVTVFATDNYTVGFGFSEISTQSQTSISDESIDANETMTLVAYDVTVFATDNNTVDSDFSEMSTLIPTSFTDHSVGSNGTTTLVANDVTVSVNNTIDSNSSETFTQNPISSTDESINTNETTTLVAYDVPIFATDNNTVDSDFSAISTQRPTSFTGDSIDDVNGITTLVANDVIFVIDNNAVDYGSFESSSQNSRRLNDQPSQNPNLAATETTVIMISPVPAFPTEKLQSTIAALHKDRFIGPYAMGLFTLIAFSLIILIFCILRWRKKKKYAKLRKMEHYHNDFPYKSYKAYQSVHTDIFDEDSSEDEIFYKI